MKKLFGVGCFILIISVLGLAACSVANPRVTVIPNDTSKWETDLRASIDQLSAEEKTLLTSYVVRNKLGEVFGGKGIPAGTTIQNAIDQERTFEADQKAKAAEQQKLKEDLQAKQIEAQKQFDRALTTVLVSKGFRPASYSTGSYSDYILLTLGFQNKTDKTIQGIKGNARFMDMFGDTIYTVSFKYEQPIPPQSTRTYEAGLEYNQFMNEHQRLKTADPDKIEMVFLPEAILFTDGTKLEAPPVSVR